VVRSPKRDTVQARLKDAGIGTLIHYPIPPHRQAAYADLAPSLRPAPLAETLAEQLVSLPMGPHLTDEQLNQVAHAVVRTAEG
jgi:dTDP-4-amino-4,6-dideoxygalactose transaminase